MVVCLMRKISKSRALLTGLLSVISGCSLIEKPDEIRVGIVVRQISGRNLVFKDEKKVGIEICISTFKTEFLNVVKDKGKCDRLIIVCIDNNAKKKLLEELRGFKNEIEAYALHEFVKVF